MRSTKLILGWFSLVTLAACGGSTETVVGYGDDDSGIRDGSTPQDGGGGTDSGGGQNDSGGGGVDAGGHDSATTTGCPASAPTSGACSPVGIECEYGTNANPACDTIVDCTQAGWSTQTGSNCAMGGTCPATYDQVPKNQQCTPEGLSCSYAAGQCNCAIPSMIAHPFSIWECTPTTQGCPTPRPDLGTACTQDGLMCDYGACTGGNEEECRDGAWVVTETPCPASNGP